MPDLTPAARTPRSARRGAASRIVLAAIGLAVLLTALHFPYATDPEAIPPSTIAAVAQAYESSWDRPPAPPDPNDVDYRRIVDFVKTYNLQQAKVLEIGAGTGKLQDVVHDYTGLDISASSRGHFRKPFIQASATAIPVPDDSFDVIWTINVLEHVPHPEHALREMRRVLRHGGYLYLSPAWQCRPWAAEGYQVRPWSDFGWRGKLIKASIPIRDSVAFRLIYTAPIRVIRFPAQFFGETRFRYRLLAPKLSNMVAAGFGRRQLDGSLRGDYLVYLAWRSLPQLSEPPPSVDGANRAAHLPNQ
jgi:SAM-dependent methyltransferase